MKILHTSDWHVGKVLKGRSRLDEQITALAGVIEIAKNEQPDLILVAGDLYDTAQPIPEATRVVTRALTALRATGADVVVIGGNHDNAAGLDALRSWADAAGITLRGRVSEKAEDHIIRGTTKSGEKWRCVALPFLSQRYAVRALEMFELTEAEAQATYADHVKRLVSRLSEDARADEVKLIMAHMTVVGGLMGGGEREAHTILGYAVPASVFPSDTHYVALGHLHRAQVMMGACPIRYSGSPIAIDFGEEENVPSVTMIEVKADTAATTRPVAVPVAVPLRTIRGTLADLSTLDTGDAWLRVYVQEPARAGLREAVQELFPRALEIRVDVGQQDKGEERIARAGRSASELFADYLTHKGSTDVATQAMFDRLYDEVSS
ncbi:exonuclease SbcCD subunit D [Catelliglobosispora koreensis]|uniref:exonuclease SbcCD subunit D n=1 Tax=Catelliglobosispora koreensis TaxID=129052 RepID=UPI00037D5593|nr:exonuclease SbcCD subunit D [Catelliglobosispora koreensis]